MHKQAGQPTHTGWCLPLPSPYPRLSPSQAGGAGLQDCATHPLTFPYR